MAYFGKTFKLFALPTITENNPAASRILQSINQRIYIKQISLYCPIVSTNPNNVISSSGIDYANADGTLLTAAGNTLDSITNKWQQQGFMSYGTLNNTSQIFRNIMGLFPLYSTVDDAYNGYLIWDEQSDYALAFYKYNYTFMCVKTDTGEKISNASALAGLSHFNCRNFKTDPATWDRCYPFLHFYYNGTIYSYSITNNSSATAKFKLTRDGNNAINTTYLNSFWWGASTDYIPIKDTDPFSPGGNSGTGGGNGTFDGTSTPIPIPGLPSLSAVDTGFITLFNPSLAQLKNLASYMWSGTFDINTFKKLFADPMDCILGLSIVPVAVPNGGSQSVKVGNVSTGVSMTLAGSQYVSLNCGTINVKEYWGSYLDYAPYSKASIYLPYCGVHPIDIDEIMDKTITVEYHVDILSGACVAFIMCGDSVLYSFTGQCASSIPVSGNDFTQMINGIITASTAIGSMVATGGATAPVAVPQLVSTAVNSMKPEVEKSGSLSGTGGMLAIQTPYLILTLPRQALPADQNKFTGYPSFITSTLGDLTGYTEVEEIHLDGIPATDGELSEILNLLKSGVIL